MDKVAELGKTNGDNSIDCSLPDDSMTSLNDTVNCSIVENREHLQKELTGLNHRLETYISHVRKNEALLKEKEAARLAAKQALAEVQETNSKQLNEMQTQLESRIRESVVLEAQQLELQRDVEDTKDEVQILKNELLQRRKREASLERVLIEDRNVLKSSRDELIHLRNKKAKEQEDKRVLSENLTKLKVENETLKEKVKIASFELTMQESKVFEVEKKLQFTAEDVEKKLAEQRTRLVKAWRAKVEEERNKQKIEMERIKKEFVKKLDDSLVTYVSVEKHEKLRSEAADLEQRAEIAEQTLAELERRLEAANKEEEQLKARHEKELMHERKRRDRLNKRLLSQIQGQEDVKHELETYRKLIETLDSNGDLVANTPLAAKRKRTETSAATSFRRQSIFSNSHEGTPMRLSHRTEQTAKNNTASTSLDNDQTHDGRKDCGIM